MSGKFYTKALNLSSYLSKVYQTQGYEAFAPEFDRSVGLALEGLDDNPEEVDRRLTSLATGLSLSLFRDNREPAMQFVVELPRLLAGETSREGKKRRFVEGFGAVVKQQEINARGFSEKVVAYLKAYPIEKLAQLSVDLLADHFQFSRGYFSRKFQEEQGVTLHDALIYEKFNRAFGLLSAPEPRMAVKDVAAILGFSDQKYFSALFKEKYGFYPSDIIRMNDAIRRNAVKN